MKHRQCKCAIGRGSSLSSRLKDLTHAQIRQTARTHNGFSSGVARANNSDIARCRSQRFGELVALAQRNIPSHRLTWNLPGGAVKRTIVFQDPPNVRFRTNWWEGSGLVLWSEVDNFIPSGLDSARSNEASAAESLSSSQATTKRNALP